MYSFFVLGIVPGTNIVISFQVWVGLVVMIGVMILHMQHVRRNLTLPARQPLHANQLHLRG